MQPRIEYVNKRLHKYIRTGKLNIRAEKFRLATHEHASIRELLAGLFSTMTHGHVVDQHFGIALSARTISVLTAAPHQLARPNVIINNRLKTQL